MLVGRLDEWKRRLQFDLPGCVGFDREAGLGLACSVQLEQLVGNVRDGAAHPGFGPLPLAGAQPSQRGRRIRRTDVRLDPIQLVGRHQQPVTLGEADVDVFTLTSPDPLLHDALESANPAVDVYDEVASLERFQQVGVVLSGLARAQRPAATLSFESEDLGVTDQRDDSFPGLRVVELPSFANRRSSDADRGRVGWRLGFKAGQRQSQVMHQLRQSRLLE